jgi:WD40 repeat protein
MVVIIDENFRNGIKSKNQNYFIETEKEIKSSCLQFQIWDLATGTLKLSLTGHISAVRGVCVSPRQPYLFSCGEDKKVMCWDLEQNKVMFIIK